MRILNTPAVHALDPLPTGKLTVRHRQMRGVFQFFAGRTLLDGASGGTPEEAAEELRFLYEIPSADTEVTIYGYENPVTKLLTELRKED